jgi:hypothetical protein
MKFHQYLAHHLHQVQQQREFQQRYQRLIIQELIRQ